MGTAKTEMTAGGSEEGKGGAAVAPPDFWTTLGPPPITLTMRIRAESLNKLINKRSRWQYVAYQQAIKEALTNILCYKKLWRRLGPFDYAAVEIESIRTRLLEAECNLTSKPFIDELVYAGVLHNDHQDKVRRRILQRLRWEGEPERTIIRLWPLAGAPPFPGGSPWPPPPNDDGLVLAPKPILKSSSIRRRR